jgi:hypothetical protein
MGGHKCAFIEELTIEAISLLTYLGGMNLWVLLIIP